MSVKIKFNPCAILNLNQLVFQITGFWKPDTNAKYAKVYNVFTLFWIIYGVILYHGPMVTYMYINRNKITELTSTTFVVFAFSINYVKVMGIYLNMDKIKMVIKALEENHLFQVKGERHLFIALRTQKISKGLLILGSFLGVGTFLFWLISPLFQRSRVLVNKAWLPYDFEISPYYELTLAHQHTANAYNILLTLNIDHFLFNLMLEIGLQCDMLSSTLNHLNEYKTDGDDILVKAEFDRYRSEKHFSEEMNKNLVVCIKHHTEIIKLIGVIENSVRTSLLILFLGGAFTLCTLLYQLTIVNAGSPEFIMLCFFLVSMMTEQFVFCWCGSEMTAKSEKVFRSLFEVPRWYGGDKKIRRNILIWMLFLNKPILLSAGKLIPTSLGVFLNVIRTSYSYFALLKKL